MKKKIAIVHGRMVFGGAERVLINLLRTIDYQLYDVDLYLTEPLKKGEDGFENRIDQHVQVKYINALAYSRINPYYSNKYYDCAIAYQGLGLDLIEIINHHLRAKCRVAWIHGDCSRYDYEESLKNLFIKEYLRIDKIYCVSKKIETIFHNFYPILKNKTEVFYNVINRDEIITCANEEVCIPQSANIILSVGRITPEKGHILIPEIAKKLKDDGYKFKWYIVGDGSSRIDVENEIIYQRVADCVEILGYKSNPYPYIKACDLLVLPSFAEGYGMVAAEALVLNRPIVVSSECGIAEQIQDQKTGLISKNATVDDLYNSIRTFLSNDTLRTHISNNVSQSCWDNHFEIDRLNIIIDNSPRQSWSQRVLVLDLVFNVFCKKMQKKVVRLFN